MRIVVTGAEHPQAARFIERMMRGNELFGISTAPGLDLGVPVFPGAAGDLPLLLSFVPGAEVVVHFDRNFVPSDLAALSAAAAGARVRRLVVLACGARPVRVALSAGSGLAPVLLQAALPVGDGDPYGVEAALVAWARRCAPGAGRVDLVDHQDLDGAVESALARGQPGCCYALCGPRIGWSELHAHLGGSAAPGAPVDPRFDGDQLLDDGAARAALGWWHRDPLRTLRALRGAAR